MLVGAGGNAGNQATVRVIREIAVGTMNTTHNKQTFVLREILMACSLSVVVGLFGFVRVLLFSSVTMPEALAITTALMAIVLISIILGALMPLLFQLAGVDPANSSTTIQVVMDITGVLLTCLTATTLLDSAIGTRLLSMLGIS